jgi:hypothetical protein
LTRRKPLFPPVDPATNKRPKCKGRQKTGFTGVSGHIKIRRRRYQYAKTGNHVPVDDLIDRAGRRATLALRELCCMLNSGAGSFEITAKHLRKAAGVCLSGETIRKMVEAAGEQAGKMTESGLMRPVWSVSQCSEQGTGAGQSGATTYVGMDGFMSPVITREEKEKRRKKTNAKRRLRGKKARKLPRMKPGSEGPHHYKETKLVTFYNQDKKRRQVSVTRGGCDAAGLLLARDAKRLRFETARERVAIADGAAWIKSTFLRQDIGNEMLILDFYHFSEHVHEATRAVHGQVRPDRGNEARAREESHLNWTERLEQRETAEGQAKARQLTTLAKEKGYDAVWRELMDWRADVGLESHRAAIDRLAGYVSERKENLDYPAYLARGWDIGSGPTESMCKLIPSRVKGRGRRWDADNSEAIMNLEALEQSGQTEEFWRLQTLC